MKISHKCILFLGLISLGFIAQPVFAAELFFESDSNKFTQGQEFTTSIFLNTQNESVNAIEGTMAFPTDLLEVKEIRDGNSQINFWIERPNIKQSGMVSFSGIIPGGYHNEKGLIFSLVFKAQTKGSGVITLKNTKVLLNDGKGTLAKVSISPFLFSISDKSPISSLTVDPIKDSNPPEEFKPEISQSPDLFDGKWFLVFVTQDKGSGIDHYEIREGTDGNFIDAQSPYLLLNQTLDKKIFIKAVDKNGNARLQIVYPQNWRPWYKSGWIFGILILAVLFFTYGAKKILSKRLSKSR